MEINPSTCIFDDTFLESSRFLAYALHSLTSIEIPLHAFGAYLIIFKTPKSMKSAQFSILQLHILCTFMDLTITSLWAFYVWIPSPAGFPVGLMSSMGINSTIQTFFAFNIMLAVALSYVSLFENRYDVVVIGQVGRSKYRNLFRKLYFGLNIIYVECTMVFIYSRMPDQEASKGFVAQKQPCIPSHLLNNPNFVNLNARNMATPYATGAMVSSICLQGLYFLGYTTYYLFLKGSHSVSRNTRNVQRKFFFAMFLQAAIPAMLFAAPLYGYAMLYKFDYFNQLYNNFLMITIGCNGLFSTLAMILVHHPYRTAVMEMIRMRKLEWSRSSIGSLNLRPIVAENDLAPVSGG